MKKILSIFLMASLCFGEGVQIGSLPLVSAPNVGANDSFPFVSYNSNTTSRFLLSNILSIPSLQNPTFSGPVTAAMFIGDGSELTNLSFSAFNPASILPNSAVPPPTYSLLGGTEAIAQVAHNWINSISTSGVPSLSRPSFLDISGTVSVSQGGTGLTSGTSGGILGFTASGTLASSAALTASQLVIGGGAGATPTALAAGSQYNVLTMGASNPGYGQVALGQSAAVTGTLPVANGGTGATSVNAGLFFAGPVSGSAAAPGFRALSVPTVSTALNTGTTTGTGNFVSGTYTPPAGVLWLEVEMVGGGGGGSSGAHAGVTAANTTTFSGTGVNVTAGAGAQAAQGPGAGGSGGTNTITTATDLAMIKNIPGAGGQGGFGVGVSGVNPNGGSGGGTSIGAGGGGGDGGSPDNGQAPPANSGAGGGGGGSQSNNNSGAGGGGGGYLKFAITTLASGYSYSVGSGGSAGGSGTNQAAGGAGAAGGIWIIEHWQ